MLLVDFILPLALKRQMGVPVRRIIDSLTSRDVRSNKLKRIRIHVLVRITLRAPK